MEQQVCYFASDKHPPPQQNKESGFIKSAEMKCPETLNVAAVGTHNDGHGGSE